MNLIFMNNLFSLFVSKNITDSILKNEAIHFYFFLLNGFVLKKEGNEMQGIKHYYRVKSFILNR